MTINKEFQCLTTIGNTIVAGDYNEGLYYSKDKGKTWRQSNITCGDFYCLTVMDNTVIAGSYSNKGLFYSEDKGKTWNQSNINIGYFRCLTVIGSTVITGSYSYDGLLYSEDKGKTWHYSRIIKYDEKEDEGEDNTILNSLRDKLLSISNEVNNYVNLEKKVVSNDEYITYIYRQIKDIITKYQFSENKKVKSILNELLKLF